MKIEIDFSKLRILYDDVMIRKFKDMKACFKNPDGVKGNPLIYKVYRKDFGGFETGLNVMEAGNINGEYFMTKGHMHKIAREEIYILIKGKGKLLIQKGKKIQVLNMKKNKVYIVPKNSGHRLINTGNGKLEVLTIYSKDATRGYDYNFKKRFFK
jgi:glucose-6-phosphate isomerase